MDNVNVKKEKQYFHYIYKIHFLRGYPAGRYYLGKRTYYGTEISADTYRGSGIFCDAFFKKYGRIEGDTYIKEIIEINPSMGVNRAREEEIIGDLWKTDPLCMNLAPGGNGYDSIEAALKKAEKNRKPINQYNLDGSYIKTWNGIAEAARALNIQSTGINKCLVGKIPSSGGFMWKYFDGNIDNIEPHYTVKPIDQYSESGEFIKTWPNNKIAGNELGIHTSDITRVCEGKRRAVGGYVWRYKGDPFNKYDTKKKESVNNHKYDFVEIEQCTLDGKVIKIWDDATTAANSLNIRRDTIANALNGVYHSAGGYLWKVHNTKSE